MRSFALATATLLLATTLATFAPAASAAAFCSELANGLNGGDCQHLLCYGRTVHTTSSGYRWESCTLSEDDLFPPCDPVCWLP